jgi:NAD(P)-dependent dehydrogenase (short-subunit alcohol dehydrogenase family)
MVAQGLIAASNATLPTHLTGVFVGGTSGIGEYTLKAFARHCQHPKAYFIGRSQAAADRILSELHAINGKGEYLFINSDVGLLKNVDDVARQIAAKEQYINILFLTTGTFIMGVETAEGLHHFASIHIHSRTRFIVNLLPLLRAAPDLRRVVSVFAGTKEGPLGNEDLQMRDSNGSLFKFLERITSATTLALEETAKLAPEVSFVHDYPGAIRSNIARGGGMFNLFLRVVMRIRGPFVWIPDDECGDTQLYIATSARYPPKVLGADGVTTDTSLAIARGTDGEVRSGVYVIDENCEEGSEQVVQLLKSLRESGRDQYVWNHIQEEFSRITGKSSMGG